MYCKYDITAIIDEGNKVSVIADCWEGDFETVTDPVTNEESSIFVRANRFNTITAFFEKNPVSDVEKHSTLLRLLNFVKGERIVIE